MIDAEKMCQINAEEMNQMEYQQSLIDQSQSTVKQDREELDDVVSNKSLETPQTGKQVHICAPENVKNEENVGTNAKLMDFTFELNMDDLKIDLTQTEREQLQAMLMQEDGTQPEAEAEMTATEKKLKHAAAYLSQPILESARIYDGTRAHKQSKMMESANPQSSFKLEPARSEIEIDRADHSFSIMERYPTGYKVEQLPTTSKDDEIAMSIAVRIDSNEKYIIKQFINFDSLQAQNELEFYQYAQENTELNDLVVPLIDQ